MEPHGFTNLGAKDKTTDTRDIILGAATPKVYTFTPTLTNVAAFASPVEYQGQQPACGAHSGSKIRGIAENTRYTPRFTWADVKTFDGWPLDAGTDNRSVFKSITKTGTLDFNLMGNEVGLTLQQYAHPVITSALLSNAKQHTGMGYGFIQDLSFDGLKQFIFDHGPCIVTIRVGHQMWTALDGTSSWQEKDVLPLRPPTPIVSGHFVVAHSYDEKYIYFINSWSDAWGRKGHGYFGVEYMPWVNDAGALFPLMLSKDLKLGMTDPDVKTLQKQLNKDPRTQVAANGPGSIGQETTYFGSLTYNAVLKFQILHNILPQSGFVGPLTRAVLNLLA